MNDVSRRLGTFLLGLAFSSVPIDIGAQNGSGREHPESTTLFLSGDVMTGRGIDQIFKATAPPRLYEPYVRDAREYLQIAERKSGSIPRNVGPEYIWGDALGDIRSADLRVINLETSITDRGEPWPGKGIHYRMHPANTRILTAAAFDCAVLANNHVLDWGYAGLADTVVALRGAGIAVAGAGSDHAAASYPAVLTIPGTGGAERRSQNGADTNVAEQRSRKSSRTDVEAERSRRLLVFGIGYQSSGIPAEWNAGPSMAGVNFATGSTADAVYEISSLVGRESRSGDIVLVSVHWGGNWGYEIPDRQIELAHALIDEGGVDIVHGHSSHHPKAIEVYRGRLILYGCGDFINDYEGISGHESYRTEIALGYFPEINGDGTLRSLQVQPYIINRFRLNACEREDAEWIARRLTRISKQFGTQVVVAEDERLNVRDHRDDNERRRNHSESCSFNLRIEW